jgi:hypothetical protein
VPRAFVAQGRAPAAVANHAYHRLDQGRVGHHAGLWCAHRAVAQVGLDEHPVARANQPRKWLFDQGQGLFDRLPEGFRLVGGVADQGND